MYMYKCTSIGYGDAVCKGTVEVYLEFWVAPFSFVHQPLEVDWRTKEQAYNLKGFVAQLRVPLWENVTVFRFVRVPRPSDVGQEQPSAMQKQAISL